MYCKKCGKETSDAASFCPYCGAKTAAVIADMKEEIVNPASTANKNNETEELPVYKRKNKAAFFVGFIPLIYAIIHGLIILFSWVGIGGK